MAQSTSTPASSSLEAPKSLLDIFPPVHKSHILNCAFASWHSLYRPFTPKAHIIPLTPEFLTYLREDGIVLPDDEEQLTTLSDSDDSDSETDNVEQDRRNPTQRFPQLHERVKTTIRELGGRVCPKLNWSCPKDAAFMMATNSLECRTPGDVYLLLKSSDFVTHDLEHAFRDCADEGEDGALTPATIPYHLTLRKWFLLNPSLEFRVFVAGRRILAITQRDRNHYDFLFGLRLVLVSAVTEFFKSTLRDTFPDSDYAFDVFLPLSEDPGLAPRVWLIDINPFAPRTDPVLFSWVEILRLRSGEDPREVELRLVGRDDPEAYQFASPQYGASKLPRDVVEVGLEGEEAVWEFARRWKEIVDKAEKEREEMNAASAASAALGN